MLQDIFSDFQEDDVVFEGLLRKFFVAYPQNDKA